MNFTLFLKGAQADGDKSNNSCFAKTNKGSALRLMFCSLLNLQHKLLLWIYAEHACVRYVVRVDAQVPYINGVHHLTLWCNDICNLPMTKEDLVTKRDITRVYSPGIANCPFRKLFQYGGCVNLLKYIYIRTFNFAWVLPH